MFAAKLVKVPLRVCASVIGKVFARKAPLKPVLPNRSIPSQSRLGARRTAERTKTIKEMAQQPAMPFGLAIIAGRGVLAGAAAVGIGALCYYGLGMSRRKSERPQYVRDRIRSTYIVFGSGLAMTALSAVAIARSPAIMSRMMSNSRLAIGTTFAAAVIGSGILCRSIPYTEGFGAKHLAWMLHSGVLGAVIAPLTLLGGSILVKAARYTAGVIRGGMFFPPTSALGSGLYAISVYGGVVLFGGFLLRQHIVRKAESHPANATYPFDPINAVMDIHMDTIALIPH